MGGAFLQLRADVRPHQTTSADHRENCWPHFSMSSCLRHRRILDRIRAERDTPLGTTCTAMAGKMRVFSPGRLAIDLFDILHCDLILEFSHPAKTHTGLLVTMSIDRFPRPCSTVITETYCRCPPFNLLLSTSVWEAVGSEQRTSVCYDPRVLLVEFGRIIHGVTSLSGN